jgi:hypothetical protein
MLAMTETPRTGSLNPAPAHSEQRRSPRRRPTAEAVGQVVVLVDGWALPSFIVNLSLDGAALCLLRAVERGTVLDLELRNLTLGFAVRRRLRVTHVSESSDGFAIAGGVFLTSLSRDELQALLW